MPRGKKGKYSRFVIYEIKTNKSSFKNMMYCGYYNSFIWFLQFTDELEALELINISPASIKTFKKSNIQFNLFK